MPRAPCCGKTGVKPGRHDEAVEVDLLNGVEVHHGDVLDAGLRQADGDIEPDGAAADNENSESRQVPLDGLAPGRDSPHLRPGGDRGRSDGVVPMDAEPTADDADTLRVEVPLFGIPCPCQPGPVAS
nr:hypothetical protein GCM10017745_66910 [Saccharothrix mutabilis subsp. capreolus]